MRKLDQFAQIFNRNYLEFLQTRGLLKGEENIRSKLSSTLRVRVIVSPWLQRLTSKPLVVTLMLWPL